ncbi:AraC family transcriptional regulator [Foetidibacter luteolus]|uniref:AraC family transcriptional regulator n=1 Tax=Foetidibacter luteolus TaxID=2608880 RepID=UPI00129B8FFE|nr:AraC family transcriptional regulator [Foetidibacter luteolus]
MKPLIEKLPLNANTSFVAQTHRTPKFEVPWHQHVEYELILFTEGEGASFIGNYVGEFKTGDVFFLGSNLPHTFQKAYKELITSAVVVHFKEDFWGDAFMNLPECRIIRQLFETALQGLKIKSGTKELLTVWIKELEHAKGFQRIIKLCNCLALIAEKKEYDTLSTQEVKAYNSKHKERIDKIYQYTIDYFQEPVTLTDVAKNAGMSVPAFCSYFKKSTKKTYIDFLNEVRVGYACQQLIDTQKTIETICYESGFNTLANFNKQFLKIRRLTPSSYRKNFISSNTVD